MKVGSLEIDILANLVKLRSDMERAENIIGTSAARINKIIDRTASAMGAMAAGLSVGIFASWVKGAIDAADSLNKLSQRVGIATERAHALPKLWV